MSVPFGISIGDFLAVFDLARKISHALSESQGSPAEVKSLVELLNVLGESLETASAILQYSLSPAAGEIIDHSPQNGIQSEIDRCKQHMEKFWSSLKPYKECLMDGQGGWGKRNWKKVKWSLYKQEDVRKFLLLLQGHLSAFNIYATAIIW